MKISLEWPRCIKLMVIWLAGAVLKVDVNSSRSTAVGSKLKLDNLWATGVRLAYKYGYINGTGAAISANTADIEWVDFISALCDIKPIDAK